MALFFVGLHAALLFKMVETGALLYEADTLFASLVSAASSNPE
jgi:hypothetical protein